MPPANKNNVFISYSHKDIDWLRKLQKMLKPLVRNGTLKLWDDTNIKIGGKWNEEIESALQKASIAILLVSPNFLNSDFISEHELHKLLSRAEQDHLTIIWILVSDCLYRVTDIPKYQAALTPITPLDSLSESQQNQVLTKICLAIKDLLIASVDQPDPSFKPPNHPGKPPSHPTANSFLKRYNLIIIALFLAIIIFPIKWWFDFKGIVYNSPRITSDSVLQINFKIDAAEYNNLGVTAVINDTSRFEHNFSKPILFDKSPNDHSFKLGAEECLVPEKQQRRVMQPLLERGEYEVKWPVITKNKGSDLSDKDIHISFAQLGKNRQWAKVVSTRIFTFYDYILRFPMTFSIFIFAIGLTIQFFILKKKQ